MQTLIKFLLLIALPCTWASPPVKWVDEHGNTHYGDKLPSGYKASTYQEPLLNTINNDVHRQNRQLNETYDARRAYRAKEQAIKDKKQQATNKKCNDIKKRLSILQTKVRVYSRDDNGEKQYVSDEERQSRTSKYKKLLRKHCS